MNLPLHLPIILSFSATCGTLSTKTKHCSRFDYNPSCQHLSIDNTNTKKSVSHCPASLASDHLEQRNCGYTVNDRGHFPSFVRRHTTITIILESFGSQTTRLQTIGPGNQVFDRRSLDQTVLFGILLQFSNCVPRTISTLYRIGIT